MAKPPDSLIGDGHLDELSAMAAAAPPGCLVEIGVYRGGSAWRLAAVARKQGRALYLYDTFAGMPFADPIDTHRVGQFGDTSAAAVRAAIPDAHVIEGIFPETLQPMGPVAFCHIDVDQYRSTRDAVAAMLPLMAPGGVMLFDDVGLVESATVGAREALGDITMAKTARGRFYAVIGAAEAGVAA